MAVSGIPLLRLLVAIILSSTVPVLAKDYNVGDAAGWNTGINYGTWATGKSFAVGDSLVFSYSSLHNVQEVTKADYEACNAGNPVNTFQATSPTSVKLTTAGTHYYICGVSGHCANGMKLAATVSSGTASSPTAPSGSPSSSTTSPATPATTTTPTTTTTNRPPTEQSSSPRVAPVVGVLIACFVALFV